jgi:HD-like signal output (HDOD) protein
VINEPDTSVGDVASILSEDPAMSVNILKLTNSAFYGLQREVDSVKHAVMIIGLEAVKNLVLSASVLNMFRADQSNKEFHEIFWRHSLSTALASRTIARRFQSGKVFNPDPAFSSGLLHDIGKIIVCCFMPGEHKAIQQSMKTNPSLNNIDAEQTLLGFTHAQIGRELAIHWKLPVRLADAIGFHHNPLEPNDSEDIAFLISLADYVAHVNTLSNDDGKQGIKPPSGVMEYFGIDDKDIEGLKANLMEEYMKAETFMRIAGIG